MDKMASIMKNLRDTPPADFGGIAVTGVTDYSEPEKTGLPKANVLIYKLDDASTVIVRPSGTEPKIKVYLLAHGKDAEDCAAKIAKYQDFAESIGK
jgi:phosphoglucomutase